MSIYSDDVIVLIQDIANASSAFCIRDLSLPPSSPQFGRECIVVDCSLFVNRFLPNGVPAINSSDLGLIIGDRGNRERMVFFRKKQGFISTYADNLKLLPSDGPVLPGFCLQIQSREPSENIDDYL